VVKNLLVEKDAQQNERGRSKYKKFQKAVNFVDQTHRRLQSMPGYLGHGAEASRLLAVKTEGYVPTRIPANSQRVESAVCGSRASGAKITIVSFVE